MLKVGVTGGIGSGKTTVCRIFETMGIPVFYADTVAKKIMVQDEILIKGIKASFGEESYLSAGKLNSKHIAGIVFNNATELAKLNALVHPAVFRAFDAWVEGLPVWTPYILKEAALLFESGSYEMCDLNVLVTAPDQLKMKRVMDRDGLSPEAIKARMDKQMTDRQKLKLSDYVIRNNETESLIAQVLILHRHFLTAKASS